jgi:hypothetical protein
MLHDAEDFAPSGITFPLQERDGSNPIERKAVYRAQLEIRSMPASLVVQIALWPDKLADWARETSVAPSVVYNMLAGVKPYHRVRNLLARRLNVPKRVLDHLIDAPRPEPLAKVPPDPPAAPEIFSFSPTTPPPVPVRPAPAVDAERDVAGLAVQPTASRPQEAPPPRNRRGRRSSPASQISLNI